MPNPPKTERNARIMELFDGGLTWEEIAAELGLEGFESISRQRVGKIIHEELERGEKDA